MLSVANRFCIGNETSGDGCGEKVQQYRAAGGHEQAVRKRRFDGVFHALHVAGAVIVTDQRERSLRHALRNGIGQQVYFLGNTHAGNGGIGVSRDHVIECRVGDSGHHRHHKTGQTDGDDL